MHKKRILVCGTGFGKIYLKTIVENEKYELAGIIGKGSDRTKKIANDFNVPVYTNIENVGNTFCASIPIALDEMFEKHLLKKEIKLFF